MPPDIERLDKMTPDEERDFWILFERELTIDDGRAAKAHLAAGNPIYFCEVDTPEGLVIKQYPNGRRELVYFDQSGERLAERASRPSGRAITPPLTCNSPLVTDGLPIISPL